MRGLGAWTREKCGLELGFRSMDRRWWSGRHSVAWWSPVHVVLEQESVEGVRVDGRQASLFVRGVMIPLLN